MKTKLFLIAIAAVTLLSFTLISNSKSTTIKSENQNEQAHKGFALQDSNQF
jgi:hypothetical protein